MNYQAESAAVEIKRLRDCYAELSKLHQADRRLDEQRIDTLRTRVAELESALRGVLAESTAPSNPCDASMYYAACRSARAALDRK